MLSLALHRLILPVVAMTLVVVASNILVQYPFEPFGLGDYHTWGAFTYPVAFLVTDLTNRRYGPAMARRLVAGLTALKGVQLLYRVDANEIFVVLPAAVHDALQQAGAQYHPWPSDRPGERAFRLVTAFDTDPAAVDKFLAVAKAAI